MIKDWSQALAVQKRRVAAGKQGHAKAVLRYLKRAAINPFTGFLRDTYRGYREEFPTL